MTQHPSLKAGQESSKFRSVLKRFEKIKELAGKEKWNEEKDSVYRLPKVKRIKFKIKKVKAAEEEAVPVEGAAAEAAAGAPAGGAVPAKEGAPSKEAAPSKGVAPAGGAEKKGKK